MKNLWIQDVLQVTRSYNLLIILLTQYLVYIFLVSGGFFHHALHPEFFLLCISTICIAAAGYIINDYHDVKIDMINKPARVVVGNKIKRRFALLLYFALSFIGISLGFIVSWKIGAINVASALLLWLYSIRFKKVAFIGNLSIAILTSLSILVIYVWKPSDGGFILLTYAWFAFIITLIREIIKDMEDMKGDMAYNCKTLPIVYGLPKTARVLYLLNMLMIISLIAALFYTSNILLKIFAAIVIIQVCYLMYRISKTDTISGFRKLGRFCKIIMLTGIAAILFY